jgi:hypothetical protein
VTTFDNEAASDVLTDTDELELVVDSLLEVVDAADVVLTACVVDDAVAIRNYTGCI